MRRTSRHDWLPVSCSCKTGKSRHGRTCVCSIRPGGISPICGRGSSGTAARPLGAHISGIACLRFVPFPAAENLHEALGKSASWRRDVPPHLPRLRRKRFGSRTTTMTPPMHEGGQPASSSTKRRSWPRTSSSRIYPKLSLGLTSVGQLDALQSQEGRDGTLAVFLRGGENPGSLARTASRIGPEPRARTKNSSRPSCITSCRRLPRPTGSASLHGGGHQEASRRRHGRSPGRRAWRD